ncbi:MAG: thioredoxin [Rhizobiaceae bacterium]
MSEQDNPYAQNTGAMGGGYTMGGSVGSGQTVENSSVNPTAAASPDGVMGGVPSSASMVQDVTTQSFVTDVIQASKTVPVIVDFWAPWCGPCKQLGPVIEKVVTQAKGAVRLAKMDIEQHPDIAGQMGIQSIPAVVAFVDGKPADAFMGAKSEAEVKDFVEKVKQLKPTPEAQGMAEVLEEADKLAAEHDHAGAAELYSQILAQEPGNLDAIAGLGQCYVAVGETALAQNLVDSLPEDQHSKGAMAALVKTLELKSAADNLGDLKSLAAAVEAKPKDHQARFDYALALNARDRREEAAEQLLDIVRTDRKWNDDGARAQLVEFFEAWGNADEATVSGRRKLSSVLFS